jgi:Zn-dependent M16 (insulinase) family peptidase
LLNVIRLVATRPRFDDVTDVATSVRHLYRSITQNLNEEISIHLKAFARSKLRPLGALQESMTGLTRLRKLAQIIQRGEFEQFAAILQSVSENIIKKGQMRICAYVGNADLRDQLLPKLIGFVREFNGDRSPLPRAVPEQLKAAVAESGQVKKVFLQGDTKSNQCLQGFAIGSISSSLGPYLFALASILEQNYLHDLIRVELGAYGANVSRDIEKGLFFMESYRDSNVKGVLAAFSKALQQVADGVGLTDEVIESAVIRIFSLLDRPVAPQERGLRYWIGRTREDTRREREACYNLTKEQVAETAKMVAAIEPVTIVFSSPTIAPAPEDFTVIPISIT